MIPHVVFGALFLGLAGFLLTGDLVVRNAVQLCAVALMAMVAVRRQDGRIAWCLLTVANASWAIGDLDPARLSAGFLISFAFAQAGLVTLVAGQLRGRGRTFLALDGVIAGLVAATVLTAYVGGAFDGLGLRIPAIALAGDVMIVTTIVLSFAINGWRPARAWWLIACGEAFLVTNDLIMVDPAAPARLALAAWSAALLLTSYAAFFPSAPRRREVQPYISAAVSIGGGFVALLLLIEAALSDGRALTILLAGGTLTLGLVRAALVIVENQRLLKLTRAEAVTDKLTGLPNRRALIDELDLAIAGGERHTLVFFDLDGFKEYNDGFGHAAGDALLQRLAPALAAVAGRAYRLGGDEFCLLVPRALDDDSPAVAEAVDALTERGDGFLITASHGLVSIPDEVDTAGEALRRADERMYARKRRRRAGQGGQARDVLAQLLAERGADEEAVAELAAEFGRRLAQSGSRGQKPRTDVSFSASFDADRADAAPERSAYAPAGSGRTS